MFDPGAVSTAPAADPVIALRRAIHMLQERAIPRLRPVPPPSHARRRVGVPRRIAVVAPSRAPIAQPFLGGLEAHVWGLVRAMRARGHDITLYAAPGSDRELHAVPLDLDLHWLSADARADVSMAPEAVVAEHHAYLSLMLHLATRDDIDVVHNHSVHYLPVAMAGALPVPVMTTLHTPPTPWLESAVGAAPGTAGRFVAVSRHTARTWGRTVDDVAVVHNGVDTELWRPGPGGSYVVWCGRIAPEKGLHLALDAVARTGSTAMVAGPVTDPVYFAEQIRPRLGERARYVGHLDRAALNALVGGAAVAAVTPDWDEPYGLVVAEALACGTPVAAFARGGIPEIVDDTCARLAIPGDVDALADALILARRLDRSEVRRHAERHCSIDAMITGYESVLDDVLLADSA